MSFADLARARRSEHHFVPDVKISDEAFSDLIETTRFTPSGYNAQPWQFLLIRDDANLARVQAIAYDQAHITTAGNLVVVLGDTEFGVHDCERICQEWEQLRGLSKAKIDGLRSSLQKDREPWKKREMTLRNCALAAMTFLYAAADQGWATCPMMGFRQLDLKRHLDLPDHIMPIMLIALGQADETKTEPQLPRKAVGELVHYETWGEY